MHIKKTGHIYTHISNLDSPSERKQQLPEVCGNFCLAPLHFFPPRLSGAYSSEMPHRGPLCDTAYLPVSLKTSFCTEQ